MELWIVAALIVTAAPCFGDNFICASTEKCDLKTGACSADISDFTVLSRQEDRYEVEMNGTPLRSGYAVDLDETMFIFFGDSKITHRMSILKDSRFTYRMERPGPNGLAPFEGEEWRGNCVKSEGTM